MNNKYGLNMMLKGEDGLTLLARSMDPNYASMMADVVKLMAAVCLVNHDKALEAITVCGELEERGRFSKIVVALDDDHTNLKVACVQLINALVSTPDDLDFRLHLRNEFVREGLNDPLQDLRDLENDDLNVQLDIFEEHRDDDTTEFQQRFTDIKINFEDRNEIYQIITNLIQDTPSEPMFLSILQHLLLIRDDVHARPQYYKLIEECISQIVLHRGGIDPDFASKRMEIDVEPLIETLVEKAQYEEAAEKSIQLETKLELETTMRQECEAKLTLTSTNYETKIASLEKELAEAQEQAKRGGGGGGGKDVLYAICLCFRTRQITKSVLFTKSESSSALQSFHPVMKPSLRHECFARQSTSHKNMSLVRILMMLFRILCGCYFQHLPISVFICILVENYTVA